MTKEKQIEEMHLEFERWDDTDTELSLSEWLYNAGYRKASDVAREIFEEIEKLIYSRVFSIRGDRDVTGLIVDGELLAELKKKYTEEGK